MKRILAVVLFALIPAMSGPLFAKSSDADRFAELERVVQELERRVSALEAQLAGPDAARNVGAAGIAGDIQKWRQLRIGMKEADVERLLGPARKVEANKLHITWYYSLGNADSGIGLYPLGGRVQFDAKSRVVDEWTEP